MEAPVGHGYTIDPKRSAGQHRNGTVGAKVLLTVVGFQIQLLSRLLDDHLPCPNAVGELHRRYWLDRDRDGHRRSPKLDVVKPDFGWVLVDDRKEGKRSRPIQV
jgi:hypothetical protein